MLFRTISKRQRTLKNKMQQIYYKVPINLTEHEPKPYSILLYNNKYIKHLLIVEKMRPFLSGG